MRDDFSANTRRELRDRVGGRCSHPDCRKATTGPKVNSDKALRLGRAAHITAASPLGPRFDAKLTSAQRRHISNGIWLCCDHADEVDSDVDRFTSDELRRWKTVAEERARSEIGRSLPDPQDAIRQAIAILGNEPDRFLPGAIANTHAAVTQCLARIDPSVRVRTEYRDGQTQYFVDGDTHLRVTPRGHGAAAARAGELIASVFRDGAEVQLPMADVTVTGSRIIDFFARQAQTLVIGGVPHEAILRVITRPEPAAQSLSVEFQVSVRHGQEAVSVSGQAFGGLIGTNIVVPLRREGPAQKWSLVVNPAIWNSQLVTELPHFERMDRFVRALAARVPATVELEIEGRTVFQTESSGPTDQRTFNRLAQVISYVAAARTIATSLHVPIAMRLDAGGQATGIAEIEQLADMLRCIRTPRKLTRNDSITLELEVSADMLDELHRPGARIIKVVTPANTITLFGTTVQVPSLTTTLSGVKCRLGGLKGRKLRRMQTTSLHCVPGETAHMTCWYSSSASTPASHTVRDGNGEAAQSDPPIENDRRIPKTTAS